MAVSQSQIVDLLYKQAFGVTKTDTANIKSPSNESIPSPLLIRGDTVWVQSGSIPAVAAAVPDVVQAYTGASAVQCAADTTTVPIGGIYPTWLTNLTDWIPQEFGATYVVKIYVDNPGVANPTITGTQIFADGSGGSGQFYYNYVSGVLNFIGETIPAALTAGKVLYVVGYRYIGVTGVTDTGNITFSGGTISTDVTNGNITIAANGTGILDITSSTSVSGNVTANYFIGNGSQLTGLPASYANSDVANYLASGTDTQAIVTSGNISGGNVSTVGNVTANYFIGNGSQLTGLPEQYANSNVAAYLASGADSTDIITTANVSGGNVLTTGVVSATGNVTSGNVLTAGIVSASGNITGNYFIGDGSQLTGLPAGYANSDVANYLASGTDSQNIITSANVSGGNVLTTGLVSATGNVTANYFIGNGSLLTGGYANSNVAIYLASGTDTQDIITSGNISGGNILTSGPISSTGNLTAGAGLFNNGLSVVGNITATGNINYQNVTDLVVGDPLIYIGANNTSDIVDLGIVASANVGGLYQHLGFVRDHTDAVWKLFGNVVNEPTTVIDWANAVYQTFLAGNLSSTGTVVSVGNITGGNLKTSGLISSSGNITGNYLFGNASQLTSVPATLNVSNWYNGNVITNALSNISALRFNGNTGITVESLGAGEALVSLGSSFKTWEVAGQGNLVAVGEDVVEFVAGPGIVITTDPNAYPQQIEFAAEVNTVFNGTSNVVVENNSNVTVAVAGNNLATFSTTGLVVAGNITGNYVLGNGAFLTGLPEQYSNTNVAAYLASGSDSSNIITTANVSGGNLTTIGLVSATGNVIANYFIGNGSQLTGLPEQYGNANVAAYLPTYTGNISANVISATGNIAANYFIGNGSLLTGTYSNASVDAYLPTYTGNISANVISATGNVTGAYILGNGALLTGVISSYNDSNVAAYLASGTDTQAIITSGNVSGGNILTAGIISATGNITGANFIGSGTNVDIIAGSYTWTFDNAGNTAFANGTVSLTNLSAAGVISATGNITGGNIATGGFVSASANVTSGNVLTAGLVSATANVTGGNLITGGIVSATGNITANYFIGNGSQLTGMYGNANVADYLPTYTGNITAGNISVTANISANVVSATGDVYGYNIVAGTGSGGNITGANVITANTFTASIAVNSANVLATGFVSATGNVTGNYIIGNGSQLTGIVGSYANANVAAYLASGTDTQAIITSGNVTGGNITTSGFVSATGNVIASYFVGNGAVLTSVLADRGGDQNNWDTLTQMGVYTVNRGSWSGTQGTPLDSQIYNGILEVKNSTNTAITQVFYPGTVNGSNSQIQWNRSYWSGSWSPWYFVVNNNNIVDAGSF